MELSEEEFYRRLIQKVPEVEDILEAIEYEIQIEWYFILKKHIYGLEYDQ